jgi:hypothetical protein
MQTSVIHEVAINWLNHAKSRIWVNYVKTMESAIRWGGREEMNVEEKIFLSPSSNNDKVYGSELIKDDIFHSFRPPSCNLLLKG